MKTVYFIKPIGMDGPVKIGCSVAPNNRRAALRCWSPFPLEIVAELPGDCELEHRFHARFQHLFQSHEWFRYAPELGEAIERINAGTFDTSELPPPKVLHNNLGGERKPWSEESRKRASVTHRCWRMYNKSGFYMSFDERWNPDLTALIEHAERYLAEPHIHGCPGSHPQSIERQKAWLASVEARRAA